MSRTISEAEAKRDLDRLLEETCRTGEQVVIERDGEPLAVLVSLADAENINRRRSEAKQELMSLLPAVQEQYEHLHSLSEEELQAHTARVLREVRAESRDR